jgi:hypothetical protein
MPTTRTKHNKHQSKTTSLYTQAHYPPPSNTTKTKQHNEKKQIWSWCSKFKPPSGVGSDWGGTSCLRHEFGRDPLKDLSVASNADVLVRACHCGLGAERLGAGAFGGEWNKGGTSP